MPQTADNDSRVVVSSASDAEAECPLCETTVDPDTWPVAIDTEQYDADVTHRCPTDGCEGAASMQY